MAKKKPKTGGGRVTPKGTRPVEGTKAAKPTGAAVEHPPITRPDPARNRQGGGPQGPTRAGHHRGQR